MVQRSEFIAIGRLTKPHGIRGELVLSSAYGDVLQPGMAFHINGRDFELLSLRTGPTGLLVRLEGVLNRSNAEVLCGLDVYVPAASLPPLPDGEFYWHEVIGLRVIAGDLELGRVVDILQTGVYDIYVVHSDEKKEYLFPAVEEIVTNIDLKNGVMVVDPPEGLLHINAL